MRAPRSVVVPVVLVALLAGCTGESKSASGPGTSALANRLSRLERENRELRRAVEGLGSTQDKTRWITQRVQTLESRMAGLQQRLSIVERR